MHDPMTQAHTIPNPFRWWWKPWPKWVYDKDYKRLPRSQRKHARRRVRRWDQLTKEQKQSRSQFHRRGLHDELVVIWHRDPEKNGSDDSCGWFAPHLTDAQAERMKSLAWHESYAPHFFATPMESVSPPLSESLAAGRVMIFLVARALNLKVTNDQVERWACEWFCEQSDSMGSQLCYKHGYHDNLKRRYEGESDEGYERRKREARQDFVAGFYCRIATLILRELRPWWKHPRWHIWHWKINVGPLLSFKRWAFSRCAKCGGRFPWGYAPIGPWGGNGPRWFRNEPGVYHHGCDGPHPPTHDGHVGRVVEIPVKGREGETQERAVTGYDAGTRAVGLMETPPKAQDAPRANDGPANGTVEPKP